MGPTVAHSLRMRLLLLLILPFLNGRSIVRERNDVIKQALIPTLVNIIGHARMVEHGTGDDVDNLLDFMDEEKILDPFLSWLGWFTDKILEKDAEETSDKSDESGEETEYDEQELEQEQSMEEAIKEIVKEEEEEEQKDLSEEDKVMEEEVLEKEAALEESLEEEIVEEEEEEDIDEEEDQTDLAEEEESVREEKEDEKDLPEKESLEEVTEVAVAWPGDPKGYNGPEIPKGDDMPAAVPIEDEVSQNTQWA